MRLTTADRGQTTRVLGGRRPLSVDKQRAAVVRVLGVEAAFGRPSYAPGEPMELTHPRRRTDALAPVPPLRRRDGEHRQEWTR